MIDHEDAHETDSTSTRHNEPWSLTAFYRSIIRDVAVELERLGLQARVYEHSVSSPAESTSSPRTADDLPTCDDLDTSGAPRLDAPGDWLQDFDGCPAFIEVRCADGCSALWGPEEGDPRVPEGSWFATVSTSPFGQRRYGAARALTDRGTTRA